MLIFRHRDLQVSRAGEGNHVVAGWDQCGGTKHKREGGFTPVMSLTKLSSLCKCLALTKFGSTVVMFAYKGCGKKFNPNNSINRHNQLVCAKSHHRKSFFLNACLSTCWWSMKPAVSKHYCKTDIWLSCRYTKGSALSSATSPSRRGSA